MIFLIKVTDVMTQKRALKVTDVLTHPGNRCPDICQVWIKLQDNPIQPLCLLQVATLMVCDCLFDYLINYLSIFAGRSVSLYHGYPCNLRLRWVAI